MKKIIFVLPILLSLVLAPSVYAISGNANTTQAGKTDSGSGEGITMQTQEQTRLMSPSPGGSQVKDQNQIRTENKGEDSLLMVTNQEQNMDESSETGSFNRNQNAVKNMSQVATEVQKLLQIKTSGGIGEQVRAVAQEQNQAQTQIQDQLNKIDARGGVMKVLLGPDYSAIKSLKQQLEQNQLRIQMLTQLQEQLNNQGDIIQVQATIEALTQENTTLQELVGAEEGTRSLFGWLFRLFIK